MATWLKAWSWHGEPAAAAPDAVLAPELRTDGPPELTTVPGGLAVAEAGGTLALKRIEGSHAPDYAALERLVLSNTDYRWAVQRRLPTREDVLELVTAVPKGATRDQKYVWGVWEGAKLVGCLDVIRAWPQPDHLCIGLLLVDGAVRRQGVGHRALRLLAARTRVWSKVRRWQISVVQTHQSALGFWSHEGFRPTGERSDLGFCAPLVILERRIYR